MIQRDCRLRISGPMQAASGQHSNHCVTRQNTLDMGTGVNSNIHMCRQEDILRPGSAFNNDIRVSVEDDVSCDLHNPDVIWAAPES